MAASVLPRLPASASASIAASRPAQVSTSPFQFLYLKNGSTAFWYSLRTCSLDLLASLSAASDTTWSRAA